MAWRSIMPSASTSLASRGTLATCPSVAYQPYLFTYLLLHGPVRLRVSRPPVDYEYSLLRISGCRHCVRTLSLLLVPPSTPAPPHIRSGLMWCSAGRYCLRLLLISELFSYCKEKALGRRRRRPTIFSHPLEHPFTSLFIHGRTEWQSGGHP